ncbi:bacterial proteasome activator family protein [Calidifontibacter terrae]
MTDENNDPQGDALTPTATSGEDGRFVVITPDGMGVANDLDVGSAPGPDSRDRPRSENPADLVEQPAKVMRIGSMVKQLLEEVRTAGLDDQGRRRLADIHARSIAELKDGLAPELADELDRIVLPFGDAAPTDAELRIAQAQLVGWLEGLFHGIQTAIVAQQMASQAQLQAMRRGLPHPQAASGEDGGDDHPTGQYL